MVSYRQQQRLIYRILLNKIRDLHFLKLFISFVMMLGENFVGLEGFRCFPSEFLTLGIMWMFSKLD